MNKNPLYGYHVNGDTYSNPVDLQTGLEDAKYLPFHS